MIDVNPAIIGNAFSIWHSDTLEHYQEEDDYYALDLSKEEDARYAIKRWLLMKWRNDEEKIYKESLRYAITKDVGIGGNFWLSGLDDMKSLDEFKKSFHQFLLWLWDEWFHEPFVPADLPQYRIRKDSEFVNFPHMPELWKEPIYEGEFLEKNDAISISNPIIEIKPESKIKKIVLILGLILIGLGVLVFFKYFF